MHGDVVLRAQLVAQRVRDDVVLGQLRRGAPPQDRLDRVYESRVERRRVAVERRQGGLRGLRRLLGAVGVPSAHFFIINHNAADSAQLLQ